MTLVTTDFRVKFDQMGKISLMRVEGQLTDESLPELYEVSRRYSDAIDARVSIVDLSSVSEFDVSSQSIWKLARQKPGSVDPTRGCFIVAPDLIAGDKKSNLPSSKEQTLRLARKVGSKILTKTNPYGTRMQEQSPGTSPRGQGYFI